MAVNTEMGETIRAFRSTAFRFEGFVVNGVAFGARYGFSMSCFWIIPAISLRKRVSLSKIVLNAFVVWSFPGFILLERQAPMGFEGGLVREFPGIR